MDQTTAPAASEVAEEITQTIETISHMDLKSLWESAQKFILDALPTLLMALIVLILGVFLVRLTMRLVARLLGRSKSDVALSKFIVSILRAGLYVVLSVVVLSMLFPRAVSGLVATLSILGLAISLAVQDSLSNLAGGISVLFTKPFGLGDFVMIDSLEGTVREIRLNYTVLSTMDNKTIHIPNGDVSKARIINYTSQDARRLDLNFSVSYQSDFEKAKQLICDLLDAHPMALPDPEPIVRVIELSTSAVVFGCRVWVSTENFWPLKFDLLEQVKLSFDRAGIVIPYNQLEVRMHTPPPQ